MQIEERNPGGRQGSLSIVSLGPGFREYLVPRAFQVLEDAEVLVGYKTYLRLIEDLAEGKEILASGMRKEVDRCQAAIDQAMAGKKVALVSSGDAGIYGMAGLVFDICRARKIAVSNESASAVGEAHLQIEVVPGVAAFNAAASLLGAPLMHDFAAISLSDHLTPWEVIEKRLRLAGEADFVISIYNPRSKARPDLLEKAQRILLEYRPPGTPVGVLYKAMRPGQRRQTSTLSMLPIEDVDMQSIVIVGNSRTYLWDGWMVTPRGYLDKYSV